jgi:hypothetical protein
MQKSDRGQNVGDLCNFQQTAQSKQSPIGRKFAESGHPDSHKKRGHFVGSRSILRSDKHSRIQCYDFEKKLQKLQQIGVYCLKYY